MLSKKQYRQKWMQWKITHPSMNKAEIWEFQKSILTNKERINAHVFSLHLKEDDPRCWVMDQSDRKFIEAKA